MVSEKIVASTSSDGRKAYIVTNLNSIDSCSFCNRNKSEFTKKTKWVEMIVGFVAFGFCCSGHFIAYCAAEVLKTAQDAKNCDQCDKRFTNAAQHYPYWHNGKEVKFFCNDECEAEYKENWLAFPCHKQTSGYWCDAPHKIFSTHTCLENKIGSMTINVTPEEKAAAVDHNRSKWHCTECSKRLSLPINKENTKYLQSFDGSIMWFCSERCQSNWSYKTVMNEYSLDNCYVCHKVLEDIPGLKYPYVYLPNNNAAYFCTEECKMQHINSTAANRNDEGYTYPVKCDLCSREFAFTKQYELKLPGKLFIFCCDDCKGKYLAAAPPEDFVAILEKKIATHCEQCNKVLYKPETKIAPFCDMECLDKYNKQLKQLSDDPVDGNHYRKDGIEAFDVIDAFKLNYYEATAFTYILRSKFKGKQLEDIQKTIRTLQRYETVLLKQKEK